MWMALCVSRVEATCGHDAAVHVKPLCTAPENQCSVGFKKLLWTKTLSRFLSNWVMPHLPRTLPLLRPLPRASRLMESFTALLGTRCPSRPALHSLGLPALSSSLPGSRRSWVVLKELTVRVGKTKALNVCCVI